MSELGKRKQSNAEADDPRSKRVKYDKSSNSEQSRQQTDGKPCWECDNCDSINLISQTIKKFNFKCYGCNKGNYYPHKTKVFHSNNYLIPQIRSELSCIILEATGIDVNESVITLINNLEKKIFKCERCNKSFQTEEDFEEDIRDHAKWPFQCDQCSKRFRQLSSLRLHMITHTGQKPFQCDICSKRFTQKGNLKNHIRRKHPNTTNDE